MTDRFDRLFDAYSKSIVSEARKAPATTASPLDKIRDILASAQPGDETDVLERIKEASEIGLNEMAKRAEAEMARPEEGGASTGGWLEDYSDPMDYFQHEFDMASDVAGMWDSVISWFGESDSAKREAMVECDAAGNVSAPAIEKNKKLQKFYMDYVTYGEGAGAMEDFKSATKSFLDYIHFLVVSKKAKSWLEAAQRAVREAQRAAAEDTDMKIAKVSFDEAAQKIVFTLKY